MGRIPAASRKTATVALAALLLAGIATEHAAGAESLARIRERIGARVEPNRISVSGLSSGGWMANQFHIANSAKIMGAGIIAAGPYHCAGSPNWLCDYTPYGYFAPHDSCQAVYLCTRFARKYFGVFGPYVGPPEAAQSLDSTLREATAATIDPLGNLQGDRVWLFSGALDSLAPPQAMDALRDYYAALFGRQEIANPAENIAYVHDRPVAHAMIVDAPGPATDTSCSDDGPPYISDCDYAAAGEMLRFLYRLPEDAAPPPYGDWDRSALVEFDQTAFFDTTDASVSLNRAGHLYVPRQCRGDAACPLHVAFHGCRQSREAVNRACGVGRDCAALYFFADAGYNEWADRHGIVVLYPQATEWGSDDDAARNPRGCWDWWGYSGADYFRKSGKQMRAVERMVDCISGVRPCPE